MLKSLTLLITVMVVSCSTRDKRMSYWCSVHLHEACYVYPEKPVCDNRGKTYYNECEFHQARCYQETLHFAHEGPCDGYTKPVTNLTHTEQLFLDYMCLKVTGSMCPDEFEPVCASNGVTYDNECYYEQTRCMHRELTLAHRGPC